MLNNNFDSEWWEKFLSETNQMSKATIFKDCITDHEIDDLNTFILDVITALSKLRTIEYGYRVFINNHKLDENEMNMIYNNPPLAGESIEAWCERLFEKREFGIIINSAERFNAELSNVMAIRSKPLFDKLGFPIEGVNFTVFIGNYSHTPIGIHQDMPGENVLHYHLGPGKKSMYIWENELFEKLEKKINNKNIEKFLPYAEEYSFEKGDLYFMPQGVYHVGKQENFSVALTFWFYNHSKKRILEKLNTMLLEQYMDDIDELLPPDTSSLDDLSNIKNILSIYKIPKELEYVSFQDLLAEAYRDLRYTIASNAGYRTSLFPKDQNFELYEHDIVEIEKPYQLLYTESNNKQSLYVYVRGTKLVFNNFYDIKRIIDKLNEGTKVKISDFHKVIEEKWDNETILYILSLLFKHHGIKIINPI